MGDKEGEGAAGEGECAGGKEVGDEAAGATGDGEGTGDEGIGEEEAAGVVDEGEGARGEGVGEGRGIEVAVVCIERKYAVKGIKDIE